MSHKAFTENCCRCSIARAMRAKKLNEDARPCPEYKPGKRLMPFSVQQKMPADWQCEERKG